MEKVPFPSEDGGMKQEAEADDLELLNQAADELNPEVGDVLRYQVIE